MPFRPKTRCGPETAPRSAERSRRVLRVLFDIVVGEIVGPHRGGVLAAAQVDLELHIVSAEVDELTRIADGAVAADLYAIERHVNAFWFEVRVRCAYGRQNSSPIGIPTEDSALEEIAARDRATDLHRIGFRSRMVDVNGDGVRRSLRVPQQLQCKITASLLQGSLEIVRIGPHARRTATQQDHRVVGRHAAVAVYAFKGALAGAHELIMKNVG